jgi:pimeloyl-ACP methyl ester carboxylesterase
VKESMSQEGRGQATSVQSLSIRLKGKDVFYLQAGSGPTLLLVHGLLGYSFSWRYTVPALAEIATVYALDLPGAGYSEPTADMDCCFRACAERVLRFMDALGVNDVDLLGTSHGGAVAMMVASLSPERVRRLILVDPVNPWSAHGQVLSVVLSNFFVAPIFGELMPKMPVLQRFYFRRLFGDTRRIKPGALEGYMKPLLRPGALEYGLKILRSWNRDLKELESALPRISAIPTLLIWGSLDAAVDPASAPKLEAKFHNCRLMMLEGIGHLPYEEAPEEFNQVVREFLLQPVAPKS